MRCHLQISSYRIDLKSVNGPISPKQCYYEMWLLVLFVLLTGFPWNMAWPQLYLLLLTVKQGKSEGFDSCDRPSNLKLDSNHRFFSPCDLEIWWMTSKNNRAFLLYYVKLCTSFQIHQGIHAGVTVRKRSIRVKIDILSPVTSKFDGWPSSILHWALCIISNPSVKSNLSYSQETLNSGQNRWFFCPAWPSNLMNDLEKQ